MKDVFGDPEFDSMLYGGVHDLEEGVGMIIYKIFKKFDFIETGWSCEGHIGESLNDLQSGREGYYIYSPGLMQFTHPEGSIKGEQFMNDVAELTKGYPFIVFREPAIETIEGSSYIRYWLELEMKDLVEPEVEKEEEVREKRSSVQNLFAMLQNQRRPEREVKIELAQERLSEFYKFWKELETLVDRHASISHEISGNQ